MKHIIAVEVGGSHFSIALVNGEGQVIQESHKRFNIDSTQGADPIIEAFARPIDSLLVKYASHEINGVAFAIPGPFDYTRGIAKYAGHVKYSSLDNLNLKNAIQAKLRHPIELVFRFLNDAFSFGVGEAWKGNTSASNRSIAITLGAGCGAAFIENGLPVFDRQDVPPSGVIWNMPFKEGVVDDYLSTRWFVRRSKERYNIDVSGVKPLASTARKHDHAKEIFFEFGDNLAELLTSMIDKFDPQSIIFGGNIAKASDLFLDRLKSNLSKSNPHTSIFISEDTERKALIGCTRIFDERVWNQLKGRLPIV